MTNRENKEYDSTTFLFIERNKDKIYFEGKTNKVLKENFNIYIQLNESLVQCEILERNIDEKNLKYFKGNLNISDLNGFNKLFVVFKNKDKVITETNYNFGKYTPITDEVPSYYKISNKIMYYCHKNECIVISNKKFMKQCSINIKLDFFLLFGNKLKWKAFIIRKICLFLKIFQKKSIWLISDRVNRGDDNGEVLFRYLQNQQLENIKLYFVVGKDYSDYNRMKQYGKVVSTFSKKHKVLHLLSDYVISSHANGAVVNPIGKGIHYCRDYMCKTRFVFLQHGVTKDDNSAWLNKYNRNIFGLIVTTQQEYQCILDYNYYYEPKNVWLTGMPRYDLLKHNEKKYISIMPTWRRTLTDGVDKKGLWIVKDDFIESDYFKFYNSMLNDERLIDTAKKYGYKICFMAHPIFITTVDKYERNENIIFFDENKPYREIFSETNLLVTDYSSVAFDFAYLNKPIIYCHFDKEKFFDGNHSYSAGYFDYVEHGFGEVEYTLEDSVDRIIDYMEHNCELKELYQDRIKNTFLYQDNLCCERVLKQILKYRD